MAHDNNGLIDLLRPARPTCVVDIGANPIDGDPPYKELLRRGLCRLVGFDPHPEALKRLNAAKGDHETYLPYAVGDGGRHTLRICRGLGFASLLQPDETALAHFPQFPELGRVIGESELATRRLDDIEDITDIDLLKIDVQGSELSIFQNGRKRLTQAVVVQTEVSFVPLYKEQPVFGDIDLELRRLGFVPHMFAAINKKMIAPMMGPDPAIALNQMIEADVVYVRDFTKADAMSNEQLKHLTITAHYCYRSFDLAMNCIHHLVRRGILPPAAQGNYLGFVQSESSPGRQA